MKKLYALLLAALIVAPAWAEVESETFQFVGTDGQALADGAEVTVGTVADDVWGDGSEIELKALLPYTVKNTADYDAVASMKINVVSLDNGMFQSCAFGLCQQYGVGTYQRANKTLAAGATEDLRTEWLPEAYGQCTVQLTLQEYDMGSYLEGPTLTVHFVYADPATVSALTQHCEAIAHYTLGGQRLARSPKGIHIVRYADGTCRKVIQ